MKRLFFFLVGGLVSFVLLSSSEVQAKGKGGYMFGGGILFVSADQKDLNGFIDDQAIVGTKNLGSAYEVYGEFEFRFNNSVFALGFRPSYFMQSASGGGVEAKLTGLTFFPIFRVYPLENNYIKFFFQVGTGYGNVTVNLSNPAGSGTYDGSTFGALAGIGAAFCITPSSCINVEGNARYLPILPVTGSGNTLASTGYQTNGELERNDSDVLVTLGGFQAAIGYQFRF